MKVYIYKKGTYEQIFIVKHVRRIEAEPNFWNIYQDECVSHISRDEYMLTCYGY